MDERVDGLRQVFWNPAERRLRAPVRIAAMFVLVVLVAQVVVLLVAGVEVVVALPDPVANSVVLALLTGAVAFLAGLLDRRTLRDIGLGGGRAWLAELAVGFAVGLLMAVVSVGILVAGGFATVAAAAPTDPSIVLGGGAAGVLYALIFFGGVGLFEEFVIRGYLLVNVAEGLRGAVDTGRTAVLAAVLGTAGLFGVLHAANPGGTVLSLVNIAVAGLFFGLVFAVTGRLAFPIGAHIAWNFGVGSVFGLPVSGLTTDTALVTVTTDGPTLVTGGSFGPEGGVVMLAGLAAGVGAFVLWTRLRGGDLAVDERIAVPELLSE
ncbi:MULTISPECIES: CPBP family intramembrane glutamic endopeptidase [Salinibaculum]|uniref:CPBP family intramembrane glutamic endopeptidase n=1 Tax=Salinibaculum TaxID=2732368 RepID=UPI0030D5FBD6